VVNRQQGYIAILTVLIVGAVATAIGTTVLILGADSQRSALIEQQSKQARFLAVACGQEGLQILHDNTGYIGTANLTLGQGTCSYTVASTGTSTRTITTSATVGNTVKKIQISVTINSSNISISSWQEIS
jgi:hypothetical protein